MGEPFDFSDLLRPRKDWWLPGRAHRLAEQFWAQNAPASLARENYGTERFLMAKAGVVPSAVSAKLRPLHERVEALGPTLKTHYAKAGVELMEASAANSRAVQWRLEDAFALVAQVPTLLASLDALVLAIHPLQVHDQSIDVSYSDPLLPFSIFVGVIDSDDPVMPLRLAEGIVHEAMHLQLTLIERYVPLVLETDTLHASPWRPDARPVGGILHGAYVFKVVRDFLSALMPLLHHTGPQACHAKRRIAQIALDLAKVRWLATDNHLTSEGRSFASVLMSVDAPPTH